MDSIRAGIITFGNEVKRWRTLSASGIWGMNLGDLRKLMRECEELPDDAIVSLNGDRAKSVQITHVSRADNGR